MFRQITRSASRRGIYGQAPFTFAGVSPGGCVPGVFADPRIDGTIAEAGFVFNAGDRDRCNVLNIHPGGDAPRLCRRIDGLPPASLSAARAGIRDTRLLCSMCHPGNVRRRPLSRLATSAGGQRRAPHARSGKRKPPGDT